MDTLQLPGVIPIAVITSSEIAVGMTPLVFWCLRIKDHNWLYYGAGLLILLSVYIVYVTPVHAGFGFYHPRGYWSHGHKNYAPCLLNRGAIA
ncbi:hypothetical protein YTPLAS72_31550 [Nitrospira sp.]|nr:hypothetical protein YTPLAS72_31550 [Nitrospira sp.]